MQAFLYSVLFLLLTFCSFFKNQETTIGIAQGKSSQPQDSEIPSENIFLQNQVDATKPKLSFLEEERHLQAPTLLSAIESSALPTWHDLWNFSKDGLDRTLRDLASQTESDSTNVNDVARQLAGIAPINLSPKIVTKFQQATSKGWKNLHESTFIPLRLWRQRNLSSLDSISRVFYPFGGPDAAYVTQFFPNATEYILVGLESCGSVDSAKNILKSDENLALFFHSMEHFFQKGYFVTSYMESQLSSTKVGVVPVVLSQLVQLGYEILDVKSGSLSCSGDLIYASSTSDHTPGVSSSDSSTSESKSSKSSHSVKFMQIYFRSLAQTKCIIYLRCPMENANEANITALSNFIVKQKFATLVKSGSYRLYDTTLFSNIRNFILLNSAAILQDDTGIPYRFFTKSFNVKLFGLYNKPLLKIFQPYAQQDMANAYKEQKVSLLPFRIGYGCLDSPSNLLLALPEIPNNVQH
jgi:hypothetical protein